ncbi:MAG: 2-C-methyl-D-erythritol 4-phosphate cytidylyltransferase [Bacteroidales bacterium]|jgi:2-C-methyl-D-erythritol 4-phosphate cytidylyltransferase|nr:2-C-methyl-D-erythritol 4-phosphate cytidylyltransferase [Bacteroidales bacterium]
MQCLSSNRYAVVVAAGQGKRMQSAVPKQFMLIKNKPLLIWTLENIITIDPCVHLILVLSKEHIPLWHKIAAEYDFNAPLQTVEGGEERFNSVKNGLKLVEPHSVVGIHDGVRPFVSHKVWNDCFTTAETKGNAVPVLPAKDSVRFCEDGSNKPLDRKKVMLVQTPQCFRSDLIIKAYEQPYLPSFTDDIQVLESFNNMKINLVEGNADNIKITEPFDILLAEHILTKNQIDYQ